MSRALPQSHGRTTVHVHRVHTASSLITGYVLTTALVSLSLSLGLLARHEDSIYKCSRNLCLCQWLSSIWRWHVVFVMWPSIFGKQLFVSQIQIICNLTPLQLAVILSECQIQLHLTRQVGINGMAHILLHSPSFSARTNASPWSAQNWVKSQKEKKKCLARLPFFNQQCWKCCRIRNLCGGIWHLPLSWLADLFGILHHCLFAAAVAAGKECNGVSGKMLLR